MSAEILTTLGSVGALFVAVVAGFGWFVTRMDHRFAQVDARFAQSDETNDARFTRLDDKIDAQTRELTELKIAVARLEGPRPRFLANR